MQQAAQGTTGTCVCIAGQRDCRTATGTVAGAQREGRGTACSRDGQEEYTAALVADILNDQLLDLATMQAKLDALLEASTGVLSDGSVV